MICFKGLDSDSRVNALFPPDADKSVYLSIGVWKFYSTTFQIAPKRNVSGNAGFRVPNRIAEAHPNIARLRRTEDRLEN